MTGTLYQVNRKPPYEWPVLCIKSTGNQPRNDRYTVSSQQETTLRMTGTSVSSQQETTLGMTGTSVSSAGNHARNVRYTCIICRKPHYEWQVHLYHLQETILGMTGTPVSSAGNHNRNDRYTSIQSTGNHARNDRYTGLQEATNLSTKTSLHGAEVLLQIAANSSLIKRTRGVCRSLPCYAASSEKLLSFLENTTMSLPRCLYCVRGVWRSLVSIQS